MPPKKGLRNIAGAISEFLGVVTSSGASNAGDFVALDDTGKLDVSVLPTGIGADVQLIVASEALSAGNAVNVYNNAGTPNCRKADASGGVGKRAHGFVLANVASGGTATVYFEGTNNQVTGLTAGDLFLGTAGAVSSSAPTASGSIVQRVGVATSATAYNAEFDGNPIVLV